MSSGAKRKRQSVAQTMGGVMFGFEQQAVRNQPPPEELVHHARPDAPVPAGDGGFLNFDVPDDDQEPESPWAGYEDLLDAEDPDEDPWADLAAEHDAQGDG